MVKLVISDNEGSTTVVPLVRDEISIGREEGNTIRLTERNISRRHAKLTKINGHYEIADLKSYNGLKLNGEALEAQSPLSPGDQIQIGDYSITVQSEAAAGASDDAATQVAAMPQPTLPARVVMLAEPSPGAEFSLPEAGISKLGRSEELAIPINHRSVSREHAEISREGDRYVLMDLASANGVSVNGSKVSEHILESGDIIEMGQVLFRYVEPDEVYTFDPDEAAQYTRAMGARSTANARIAMAMVAAAVAVAIGVMSSDDAEPQTAAPSVTTPEGSSAAATQAASAATDAEYARALTACREALAGRRFAEAMAHSGLALKARPGDAAATECQKQGQQQHEDEQIFVRGEAALAAGDPEAAYKEFSRLAPESEHRQKPAYTQAVEQIATTRVANARSLLPSNTVEAARLARGVLALPGVPNAQSQAARMVIADARRAEEAIVAAGVQPDAEPRPAKARKARPKRAAPAPSAPAKGGSGMKEASACLAKGDNQCVIKALAGKARTAQEMGLLIETYRAMGNAQAAQKYMTLYVKKFPTARRANSYRRMLEQ